MAHERFKIDIPQGEVERLRRKLLDTRIPDLPIVPDAGDIDYGAPLPWFNRLYHAWVNDFDWKTVQDHLNRHEHFLATIRDEPFDVRIHYTHTRSKHANAIPIILIHGWPGSFFEFDRVVDRFADPEDASQQAFHVVVPSLPGFCWSSNPPRKGWTLQDNGRVLNKLMIELGYTSYVAQAGDWGMFAAREMGARFPECKAVHLNFCPSPLPDGLTSADLTPRERFIEDRCQDWLDNHLGYAVCMRTRPQTIGIALNDNPVGILVWVGEKYLEASDPKVHNDPEWDRAILTQASLYYFSGCIMTSGLPYFENVKHAEFGTFILRPENRINVPMGYTSFLYDTRPGTKRSVERTGDLVFYNGKLPKLCESLYVDTNDELEVDDGGHFAALECPEVILQDCRTFFGQHYEA